MRAGTILTLTALALLGLSGCNKAEPPAKVQEDVAKATDSAAASDAKASDKLASADASANKEVANAEAKADSKTTDAAGDAVITQAESDHKVAVAQCESLAALDEKDCNHQTDDQFAAVITKVKQLEHDAR